VLAIITYKDEDDAIAIANDSPFGLSGYVSAAARTRPCGGGVGCVPVWCI